jgi:Raf kinase inhibitor-like YbhB/YbcL family protein
MTLLGRLLYRVRAGEHRSPLAGPGFAAPDTVTVSSTAFTDGSAMPPSSAGKGLGDNISPPLSWAGLPLDTRQVVLIMDDVDVPLPRPLMHTIAVIDPTVRGVAAGALQPGTAGMRFIPAGFGRRGYAGPRPIPGHGPHRYRFHVFALDAPIPHTVTAAKALLATMPGHVLASGVLTGTYQRSAQSAPAGE